MNLQALRARLVRGGRADLKCQVGRRQRGRRRRGDRGGRGARGDQGGRGDNGLLRRFGRRLEVRGRLVAVLQGPVDAGVDHLRDAQALGRGALGILFGGAEGRERAGHALGGVLRGLGRLRRDGGGRGDVRLVDEAGVPVHDGDRVGRGVAGVGSRPRLATHDFGGLDDLFGILCGRLFRLGVLAGELLRLLRQHGGVRCLLGGRGHLAVDAERARPVRCRRREGGRRDFGHVHVGRRRAERRAPVQLRGVGGVQPRVAQEHRLVLALERCESRKRLHTTCHPQCRRQDEEPRHEYCAATRGTSDTRLCPCV
mmetsp:Transcript_101941/g.311800  ORF Transcript_101941/g.311800 Transcript_101941/m.311800 type:complete len:312 (-) Transcript_101941:12-947(-)